MIERYEYVIETGKMFKVAPNYFNVYKINLSPSWPYVVISLTKAIFVAEHKIKSPYEKWTEKEKSLSKYAIKNGVWRKKYWVKQL